MRKEERIAAMFKFKKMDKKLPFLPTLHVRGYLQIENVTPIDSGLPYIPAREKDALMFPKRTNDYTKLFATLDTSEGGKYFKQPVGQECDQYDEVLKKYMKNPERGV